MSPLPSGGGRLERQREAVHAIAQPSWLGSIVEDVAEMPPATAAMHRRPDHPQACVTDCADGIVKRSQKLGHPVPLSNFVVEENRSRSHPAQGNVPARSSCSSGLENGRSVALCRRMANCSGVRSLRHSPSVCTTSNVSAAGATETQRMPRAAKPPPINQSRLVVTMWMSRSKGAHCRSARITMHCYGNNVPQMKVKDMSQPQTDLALLGGRR
jgi:hypothetical protein